jgi:hypothetical protein
MTFHGDRLHLHDEGTEARPDGVSRVYVSRGLAYLVMDALSLNAPGKLSSLPASTSA